MIDTGSQLENVIIIGGGVAGLSAAVYNSRADLFPLLFAGSPPGGQLTLTSEVENFPGFESILGSELIEKMRKQAQKFGTRIIDENVMKVDFSKRPFEVHLFSAIDSANGFPPASARQDLRAVGNPATIATYRDNIANSSSKVYRAKAIIIATGAKALWLGLDSETRLRGKGVSACATCDGFFFKNKTVTVIGGGDTAMEEAETLTKFASKVILIHRRDSFRASKIMVDRVLKNPKIEVIYNAEVQEIIGENKVAGIRLMINDEGSTIKHLSLINHSSNIFDLKLDGVFVAIGHKPDTDLFKNVIELDEKGYVITSDRLARDFLKIGKIDQKKLDHIKSQMHQFTSNTFIEGVFAVGDCVDYLYRQAATAAGLGVAGAMDVEQYLNH